MATSTSTSGRASDQRAATRVPWRCVPTTEAARAVGVSPRVLRRLARAGVIEPWLTLPGGSHRWRVDLLAEVFDPGPAHVASRLWP